MAGQRFRELDGLRGLAALWVVSFHLTFGFSGLCAKNNPALIRAVVPFSANLQGLQAVNLFFIISGFVICMTVDRSRTVFDFAASRFARLFPVYWAAVAISTAIGLIFPLPLLPVTVRQGILNLTMLQDYIGVRAVDPSYWSLSIELGFYGLMAVILMTRRRHQIERLGLIWMLIAFVLIRLLPHIGLNFPWRPSIALALPYASLFYAGILFYRLKVEQFTWERVGLVVLSFVLECALHGWLMWAIQAGVFSVFALAVAGKLPVLSSRPMVFFGSISYSLYVIHQPLAYRLELGFHALHASPWVNFGLTLATVIAVAYVLNHLVERPGTRLLRRLYAEHRPLIVAQAL